MYSEMNLNLPPDSAQSTLYVYNNLLYVTPRIIPWFLVSIKLEYVTTNTRVGNYAVDRYQITKYLHSP